MDPDWLIAPRVGIGRLRFGLLPAEAAAASATYGTPTPLLRGADAAADAEDTIAHLAALGTPATDLEVLRRAMLSQASLDRQNLQRGRVPILLEYRDGRLDAVTVEARHAAAHLGGTAVFALGALDALRLFERANGAPGRYRSDEAAFDGLAISLHAFSTVSAHGEVRAAPPGASGFRRRSVTARREPYQPHDEMDQFVTATLD